MNKVGQELIKGLKSGAKVTNKQAKQIADNLTSKVIKQIKKNLGIKSPSKVTEEIGGYVGQGFEMGLQEGFIGVDKLIDNEMNSVIDTFEETRIPRIKIDAISSINNLYKSVVDWEKFLVDNISNSYKNLQQNLELTKAIIQECNELEAERIEYEQKTQKPKSTNNGLEPNQYAKIRDENGDTYNFYSPVKLTPQESAREMKKAKRDLVKGF